MSKKKGLTYKDAGVDINAGDSFAAKLLDIMEGTYDNTVIRNDGGFGGMIQINDAHVLTLSTDGVGTKLEIAKQMGIHNTVGIDLVAMCANDVLAQGARPLAFLDYVVTDKVRQDVLLEVVEGIAEGCKQAGCALLGGETAEHGDAFPKGKYDLAGFVLGMANQNEIITGKNIAPGDAVIGLASSGIHSNGFSLARKALLERMGMSLNSVLESGKTLGEELLTPTRIYVKPVLRAIESFMPVPINGIAHITGGGLVGNIPRILPEGCKVVLDSKTWCVPPIFKLIQKAGDVSQKEMYRVFNMGIGMVLTCHKDKAEKICAILCQSGEKATIIGEVRKAKNKAVTIS